MRLGFVHVLTFSLSLPFSLGTKGAIYCDKTIRGSGMNGEAIRSGAVIAVKTHKSRKVAWTEINSPQILNNGKVVI